MTPSWLTDLLAGLMIAIAGYCVGRIAFARLQRRRTEHDIDVLHVLMGVAMAGMLVARLSILNNHVWEALFVAAALWFAVRGALALRGAGFGAGRAVTGHNLPYFVACAAMLYMYLASTSASSNASGGGGMTGMADVSDTASAASRFPLLGLVLAVAMVGYAVLIVDRTTLAESSVGPGIGTSGTLPRISANSSHCGLLAPRLANCCHVAMSVTMAYLLVVML
jgi:Domain of unknown function (DUF5134)